MNEIPFSSETKRFTTLHETPESVVAYAKGAPEVILESCTRQLSAAGETALDADARQALLAAAQQLAGEALRVLAVARRSDATLETAEREMTFLGLVGMIDPPRPEAKEAVRTCKEAGIKAVMITGDHPVTAQAIARELGMLTTGRAITGAELEAMDDAELDSEVEDIQVYARVSPAHKLRVVTAFQNRGHSVAMTGDGVNDAPALKKADIGIAMGITGTDVTKEAAAMTLTDDNFASIVAAVEEGRGVFGNIKKYLMYLLAANLGEIGLLVGASLLGKPLPLSAVQILYVNLATDGLPAIALSVDPPERDLMSRPPRSRETRHLQQAGRHPDRDRRSGVRAHHARAVHLGAVLRQPAGRGDDDDVRHAGADRVLQGVQLPLRPALDPGGVPRQQVAEPRDPLGAPDAGARDQRPVPAGRVRHDDASRSRSGCASPASRS